MKAAIIRGGIVVNYIEAPVSHVPPEGHQIVFTENAGVGMRYDGERFIDMSTPTLDDLLTHAHTRSTDTQYFPIKFTANGETKVMTFFLKDLDYIERASKRAERDSSLSIKYANPQTGAVTSLDSEQIIALRNALEDFLFANKEVYAGLVEAIHAKRVKTHYEVDNPPGNMKKWPPRHDEKLI